HPESAGLAPFKPVCQPISGGYPVPGVDFPARIADDQPPVCGGERLLRALLSLRLVRNFGGLLPLFGGDALFVGAVWAQEQLLRGHGCRIKTLPCMRRYTDPDEYGAGGCCDSGAPPKQELRVCGKPDL